jgi:cytochrome c biogenesis protein CcdA
VGLAWSNDPESYTGGSIATRRVSQAGQIKGDDPDKERYPGPPGWGLSVGLTALPCKKPICYGYITAASKDLDKLEMTRRGRRLMRRKMDTV